MATTLLLPAAGTGSRFGGPVAKQLLPLAGQPVMAWSLQAFIGLVDAIIIIVNDAVRDEVEQICQAIPDLPPWRLVAGGTTRMASVANGLAAVDPAHDHVLVHDAARPLITPAAIKAVIAALDDTPAAVLAAPCVDTIKRADADQCIAATEDRSVLWQAQTPQGFDRALGIAAFAAYDGPAASDDVGVLEAAGHRVRLIEGPRSNLKITTDEDLVIAAALLARDSA